MSTKRQNKRSEYTLSKREAGQLINAAPTFQYRCIIKMFVQTGIRRFELMDLDVRDIDFERRFIHIRNGKGGKERTVIASPDLITDLKHLLHKRKTGPVFMSNRNKCFGIRSLNRIVADVGKLAGIKNPDPQATYIGCHTLRHTFARLWKDSGRSIESLSKILGHTSVAMTHDEYGTESMEMVKANYDAVMETIPE